MEAQPSVERRIVSVLFADIVGFTTISEQLDPEDVATLQDAYFAAVREILTRYGGRVEKFIGDAVMAVFGLPRARDDDAERATRAGLAMVAAIEHLGARLGFADSPLQLRVGVNTGEVVATDAGDDAWRVTGDTVNTAARLQTAARPGGVLLGETTALTVADAIELGAATGHELKGKAAAVYAREAIGELPQRSRATAMGRMRSALLGREHELATLVAAAREIRERSAQRWLIVAPPGVGKSRLLSEVASAIGAGGPVLAASVQPEAEGAFAAIGQLLTGAMDGDLALAEERFRAAGAAPGRAAVLAAEVEQLVSGDAVDQSGAEPSAPAQAARFAAWSEALDLLAAPRPAIWLLEDLHWASPDLLAFLDHAHASPPAAGRLVIGTARPSLLDREPGWCEAREQGGVHRMELHPLPQASARELMTALVGDCLPDETAQLIVERSDGNPLFIEELLRTWLAVGTLAEEPDGSFRLVDPGRVVDLPATVQAIYAGQLDDLPPAARLLARHASVAGLSFPVSALPALRVPGEEALETLRTRALVEGPSTSEFGESYAYRHALLRDAGYATLARAERARLHARLATWLESAAGDRVERMAESIAGHLEQAVAQLPALGTLDDGLDREHLQALAAGWLERAARAALGSGAQVTASRLAARSVDLTAESSRLERARRHALVGETTAFSGDMDEAIAAYSQAVAAFEALLRDDDPAMRAAARDGYARALLGQGDAMVEQLHFKNAEALAERGLETIGPADDLPTARLRYLRSWARIAYESGPDLVPELEAVLAVARRSGDRWLELEALFQLQNLQAESGEIGLEASLRQAEELIELAIRGGNPRRAASALRVRAMSTAETEPADSFRFVDRAEELAEAHGLLEDQAWASYARAELGFMLGDWDATIAAAESALASAEPNAYLRPVIRTWMVLSVVAAERGRVDLL
ncbi:MAG TPA: adenylate/guanylate cyclase domain-containing protein, partial [Candidatus Limnocylindrales bacterium]|nr:adenylate/guanylate cyclase domain-containing protein [Candidatus Limnocylindrales bacterium]